MSTHLTRFLIEGKPGDVGYFSNPDKDIVAAASRKGWKIKTTRLVVLPLSTSLRQLLVGAKIEEITKVEIIRRKGD